MAVDISALMSSLWHWELAGYGTLAAVAIGVAGESIHELTDWFKGVQWWKSKGGAASALLLIAALAAELVTQVKTSSISGQTIAFLSDQEAETRERATQAELELARIRLPRDLTSEQQQRIADAVRPYPIREVWIDISPATWESGVLADEILRALRLGGIDAIPKPGVAQARRIGIVRGVTVATIKGNDKADKFATSLINALIDASIDVTPFPDLDEWFLPALLKNGKTRNDSDFEQAIVVVGDKPL